MNTNAYLERNKERFEAIKYFVEMHETILDLGVGKAGYYVGTTHESVVGVDNDKGVLYMARQVYPRLETIQSHLQGFDTEEKFSLVVMTEILEHFPDYNFLLDLAKKCCLSHYLISVPKSCFIKEHYHPEWSKEQAMKLGEKLGKVEDLIEVDTSWIIYINRS